MRTSMLVWLSRLSRASVEFIQRQPNWDLVTIGDAKKFLRATGDPNDPVVRKRWKVRIDRVSKRVAARRWTEFAGDPEESLYQELIEISAKEP